MLFSLSFPKKSNAQNKNMNINNDFRDDTNNKNIRKDSSTHKSSSVGRLNPNKNKNDRKECEFDDEEFSLIENLWEDLGVTQNYRLEFKTQLQKTKSEKTKSLLMLYEKNCLNKLREILLKLSNEITSREYNISSLKKNINKIENNVLSENIDINTILNKIIHCIKNIRIHSVNIVNKIIKLRETTSYYVQKGKHDLNCIDKYYLYDEKYLSNMNNDLLFLKNSLFIEDYCDVKSNWLVEMDTFLSGINSVLVDEKKVNISIDKDLEKEINYCKCIILEDAMLNNLQNNFDIRNRNRVLEKIQKTKLDNNSTLSKRLQFFKNKMRGKYESMFFVEDRNKKNLLKKIKKTNYYDNKKQTIVIEREKTPFERTEKYTIDCDKNNNLKNNYLNDNNKENDDEVILIDNSNNHNNNVENETQNDYNYIIEYYKDDLDILINDLVGNINIEQIPLCLKNSFNLSNELLSNRDNYIKGINPKVLLIKHIKNNKEVINGLCSFYYDYDSNTKENIIKINFILTATNWEEKIIFLINYIKNNLSYDKIILNLNDDENYDNDAVTTLFTSNLDFIIEFNEKCNITIKELTYYNKNKLSSAQNKIIPNILYNSQFFISQNLSQNENNTDKYINKTFFEVLLNEEYEKKISGSYLFKNFFEIKRNLNFNEILEINFNETLLDNENLYNNTFDIINMDINEYLLSCTSLQINNIYYNRITINKTIIYKKDQNELLFYLIPTKHDSLYLIIAELNNDYSKKLFIDNDENLYDIFNKKILSTFEKEIKDTKFNLFIPAFSIKNHYIGKSLNYEEKYYNIIEYTNLNFKVDENIENSFYFNIIEEKNENGENKNIVIQDSFLFGVVDKNIISENNSLIFQFMHVKNEYWISDK